MSRTLIIRNRQRAVRINVPLLRRLTLCLLTDLLEKEDFELGIYIVNTPEITCLNETFLQHSGSTDVITFDYASVLPPEGSRNPRTRSKSELEVMHGEIFVCIDVAVSQATRFHTTWQSELARYIIHGALHLNGFDDSEPAVRRKMKREENRLLNEIIDLFPVKNLARSRSTR